jgi:hypothetical protein
MEDRMASETPRRQPRVVPAFPLSLAIRDSRGLCVGYGVVANVSQGGACVWTDGLLTGGGRLSFTLSFSHSDEVHEIEGTVVWEGHGEVMGDMPAHRVGVAWEGAGPACKERLRSLARDAVEEALTPRSLIALRRGRGTT